MARMPELPEVEVTRRSFAQRIVGARVLQARPGKPLRWPLGCDPASLAGQAVGGVTRRGKYLWLSLERGGLLMHLGMSGSLSFGEAPPPPGPHDHFDLVTTRGVLRLHDPRRFGAVVWSDGIDASPARELLARLGVEPFDAAFTGALLHERLRGRRVAIKQALLAGDVVVGVGNIYASEALHAAGIDPRRPAGALDAVQCDRLAQAVRETLQRALDTGGSTLRDFRDAQGHNGEFQLQARVYGRAGQPCRRCGAPVLRLQQGQRATYYCGGCQQG